MCHVCVCVRSCVCACPILAIRSHSPAKPVLIFVSSRRQTRLTALDLIAYLATEDDPKQWLHQDEKEVCPKHTHPPTHTDAHSHRHNHNHLAVPPRH